MMPLTNTFSDNSVIILDGHSLTLEQVVTLSLNTTCTIQLHHSAIEAVNKSRAIINKWIEQNEVIYGVTTGFGEFANVKIPIDELEQLQENLILSHSAGAGDWLPQGIVRGMMVLRINALAKGFSGIRLQTLQTLVEMVNANIIPAVPEQGSVGSSGDLVQLSHIALALIGKGKVLSAQGVRPSAEVLNEHGITPVRLSAKEGLALINGTQMMCSFGAMALYNAVQLSKVADITGALTTEALRGTDRAFDERIHKARGLQGQILVAQNLRFLMSGSEIRESHRNSADDPRVQDAYSLRCMPQVHGASRDAIGFVRQTIETELNAATDNPLIFPDETGVTTGIHLEGGNFHGQPLALSLDFLSIACAELANISERRTERLVNGALSGLPRFLAPKGGLHSGLMIAQYTAASIVSENKVLAHPASVDSIPTSANQEDHNSMGSIAAQKAWRIVQNLERVLAIELLCAAQAIEFLRPLRSSVVLEGVMEKIRALIPFMAEDRVVFDDIETLTQLIRSGEITREITIE